jgi:NAD(P)H-flavin reductase
VEVAARGEERQPYSIASAPNPARPGVFELAVGTSEAERGLGTLGLHAELEVRGPLGHFYSAPSALPKLFVGIGTGLAPLRAMIDSMLRAGSTSPLVVLHGARDEAEILWQKEWEALVATHPNLSFVPSLTRARDSWQGRRGRAQSHFKELLATLTDPEVYVCGIALAVHDCRRVLTEELGVPAARVFVEGH